MIDENGDRVVVKVDWSQTTPKKEIERMLATLLHLSEGVAILMDELRSRLEKPESKVLLPGKDF